ncbi:hypothetical protein F66182_2708 [Fusarium sp. NRRL 66182]|nr:hypothetical protein F66182_2708 [Fusarium sp. NRRL 66182]
MTPPRQNNSSIELALRVIVSEELSAGCGPGLNDCKRLMDLAPIQPGDRVLDLVCGTGLEALIAADGVGDEGIVVGADVTDAMLDEAQKKLNQNEALAHRIKLIQHDVTDLTGCPHDRSLRIGVAISSHTAELPLTDITHEYNLRSGLLLEKVARRLDISFPSNRTWTKPKEEWRQVALNGKFKVSDNLHVYIAKKA